MTTLRRMKLLTWFTIMYVAGISIVTLWTVMIMTVKPKPPQSSPIPTLSVDVLQRTSQALERRRVIASESARFVTVFGNPEPFRK